LSEGCGDKGTRRKGDMETVTLSVFLDDEERGVKKNVSPCLAGRQEVGQGEEEKSP